jgi:phage terminase large subunit-like protein
MPRRKKIEIQSEINMIRLKAEADLEEFIKIVHPKRLLGNIHREVIRWWTKSNSKNHQLLLLPRDHMKSALAAYRVAWALTKDPTLRILYISSTSSLAIKQLKFIKDILTNDTYRLLWPEMIEKEEAKREKWTEREISVDHPKRKDESIRDSSVFTAGLTSNIVGLHCDIAVLDDVVVQSNAYTEDGREKVKDQYSYLSSIAGTNAEQWVVGTRYHPNDLYSEMISLEIETKYDELGRVIERSSLYEVFGGDDPRKIQVESLGNGQGEFLWPRQRRTDGKWFGFDAEILAQKRAQYLNKVQFRAQYYNDPHDESAAPIKRDQFQYYDQQYLHRQDGRWFFKRERLNVVAAVDFAYTVNKKADWTSIVVIGADGLNNYYILEIDRFKTDKISDYFNRILKLHENWGFRKIRAEVSAAQVVIVKDLKESYIKPLGLALSIDEYRPSRFEGHKEERILSTLEPRYANHQIWHYPHGNCQILEEELIYANPAHDDIKDALAAAVDFAVPPTNMFSLQKNSQLTFKFHTKFGGVL